MPLARIDLPSGRYDGQEAAISDAVQGALHETLGVPMAERFHVIAKHGEGRLVVDPAYLGVPRSPASIIIQVTLNRGRDAALKQAFYRALVRHLRQAAGVSPEDVVVSLVEVGREDWSFGRGEAQLIEGEQA